MRKVEGTEFLVRNNPKLPTCAAENLYNQLDALGPANKTITQPGNLSVTAALPLAFASGWLVTDEPASASRAEFWRTLGLKMPRELSAALLAERNSPPKAGFRNRSAENRLPRHPRHISRFRKSPREAQLTIFASE